MRADGRWPRELSANNLPSRWGTKSFRVSAAGEVWAGQLGFVTRDRGPRSYEWRETRWEWETGDFAVTRSPACYR